MDSLSEKLGLDPEIYSHLPYFRKKDIEERQYMGGQVCGDCYEYILNRESFFENFPEEKRPPKESETFEPVPNKDPDSRFPGCECEVPWPGDC